MSHLWEQDRRTGPSARSEEMVCPDGYGGGRAMAEAVMVVVLRVVGSLSA